MTDVHQIRLSGNPSFQATLKEVRIRCCALGISTGRVTEIGCMAVRTADADELIPFLNTECCADLSERAKAPDATYFALRGQDADALKRLRGAMIAKGHGALTLRTLAHLAVCALASKSDKELWDAKRFCIPA